MIVEQISNFVQKHAGRTFTIIVNNNLISAVPDNPSIIPIRCRYNQKYKTFELGYLKSVQNKLQLIQSEACPKLLEQELFNTIFGGVDLQDLLHLDSKIYLKPDLESNVIHLTSNYYTLAKRIACTYTGVPSPLRIGEAQLPANDFKAIFDWFLMHSMYSFYNVFTLFLLRKLRDDKSLRFYLTLGSFLPTFIKGEKESFLFNPLLEIPYIFNEIKDSLLYKESIKQDYHFRNFTVNLLTSEEICKTFGLSNYIRFNPEFYYNILFGLFSSGFPNNNTVVYLTNEPQLPKIITEADFREDSPYAQYYTRQTTLAIEVYRSSRSLDVPDKKREDLLNLCRQIHLVYV